MTAVFSHPQLGEITLSQTLRARRIAISVRGSGAVRLSYPRGVSQRRAVEFLESRADWVLRARERMSAKRAAMSQQLAPDQVLARVEELRREAKIDLPSRIECLAQQTGLKYTKLTIRASRSRWGSCSGSNTISLSLFLMALPEHLRDFVIIHELSHTLHHNHSPRFHALVDRLTGGNENALSRELKSYSIR